MMSLWSATVIFVALDLRLVDSKDIGFLDEAQREKSEKDLIWSEKYMKLLMRQKL